MSCSGSTRQNTTTHIGNTRQVVINVVDCNGEPVNVAAYNLTYTISLGSSGEPLITKTESDGITVDSDEVTILLDAADTVLASRKYWHKLVIDDGTVVETVLIGDHGFTHTSLNSCEALSATMNTIMFTGGAPQYMLDFSSASNAINFVLFM